MVLDIKEILETATDPVSVAFRENYTPNVTKEQYEFAKMKLGEILKKYNGLDNIPPDVKEIYKRFQYVVASYSKDRMIENYENEKSRRERHNMASDLLDKYMRQTDSFLTPTQISSFYAYMERGLLRGTENITVMIEKDPEAFYNLCSFLEAQLEAERNEKRVLRPILINCSKKCGGWFTTIE